MAETVSKHLILVQSVVGGSSVPIWTLVAGSARLRVKSARRPGEDNRRGKETHIDTTCLVTPKGVGGF